MTFEGDSTWVGTRITYDYIAADQGGVQYGNLTQQVESSWTGSSWLKYRAAKTQYYPYSSSSVYLVGLPARTSQYSCPGGVCGMGEGDLLARSINLYDNLTENDTDYTDPPTQGILTNQRTLLRKSPSAAYTDVKTTYDTWGNPNSVTAYTGEGSDSALATAVARTINSCYGTGSAPTCNDDGYHTYKAWEQNAVYATHWTYKKEFGVAESEDGPNINDTTTATYDTFGRLLKVIRPGDDIGNAHHLDCLQRRRRRRGHHPAFLHPGRAADRGQQQAHRAQILQRPGAVDPDPDRRGDRQRERPRYHRGYHL